MQGLGGNEVAFRAYKRRNTEGILHIFFVGILRGMKRFPRPKSLSLNSLGVCIFREEENFKSVAYFSILMKLICN